MKTKLDKTQIRTKMKEVLTETIEYYSENPRATSVMGCRYLTEDGRMCAVGRMLKPDQKYKDLDGAIDENKFEFEEVKDKLLGYVDFLTSNKRFKDEYVGIPYSFLDDLQTFHDLEGNWSKNKTSKNPLRSLGKKNRDSIIEKIESDHYFKHLINA